MKRKNLLWVSGLMSILALTNYSCKKDDDDNKSAGGGTTVAAVMTAKVDGVAWASVTSNTSGSIINNVSNLTGQASDASVITFTVQESFVLGESYDLGPASGNAGVHTVQGASSSWASHANVNCNGQITITSLDATNKKMGGTFSFKGYNAIANTYHEITEGVFSNVPYVTSLSGGGNNTFTVKIDNVTFAPAIITGTLQGGNLVINAADNAGSKAVGLQIPPAIAVGTFPLELFTTYSAQYNPNQSTFTGATSGSLTISSHNTTTKNIVGTFNFVSEPFPAGGPPTYALTNGAFNITYQ